jgi:hypothetical protein
MRARSRAKRRNDRGIASDAIRAACAVDLRLDSPHRFPTLARELGQSFGAYGVELLGFQSQSLQGY